MNADVTSPQVVQLSQSATHRALFCQEIAEEVFGHLSLKSVIFRSGRDHRREHYDELNESEKRRALASSARVSKFISDVSLSVLWARIRTLRRLVILLPQCDPEKCKLNGEPSDADWGRLEKYAAYVREARFSPIMYYEEEPWSIVMGRYRSISHFLPHLKTLASLYLPWTRDTFSDFFILSHTLQHISLDLDIHGYPNTRDGGAVLTAALERIAAAIPALSSLTICSGSFNPESPELSWKIPEFQSMRKLKMVRLTADASMLATLGHFQHLRSLEVHISDDCAHLHGCFQALTELSLSGRASHIQPFLTTTSPPLLQILSLYFLQGPSAQSIVECMSSLPSAVPTTLAALSVASTTLYEPMLTSAMDVIRPALAFRALKEFTLRFHPLPSISNDDILTMVSAWPALTTFRLEQAYIYDSPDGPPTRPSALILPMIASRCPHLDTLELPEVDLSAAPALAALRPGPGPRGHPLRVLDMSEFESGGPDRNACMRAAVMLNWLFPRMELPRLKGDAYDEGREKGWAAVVRLLYAMQAGRAHADAFERAGYAAEGDDGIEVREGSGEQSDWDEGEDEDADSE